MNRVYIMQGPPASGKSTKAKEIFDANPKGTVIASRDRIRMAMGEYWVPHREYVVDTVQNAMVVSALEEGFDVIIDDTNLNPRYLDHWKEVAKQLKAVWCLEPCFASLDECLERNRERQKTEDKVVPDEVIKGFFERYNIDSLTGLY